MRREARLKLKNSLFFSLLAGNLGVETGSTRTASATTQSSQPPKSLARSQRPRTSALLRVKIREVRSLQIRKVAWRRIWAFCLCRLESCSWLGSMFAPLQSQRFIEQQVTEHDCSRSLCRDVCFWM